MRVLLAVLLVGIAGCADGENSHGDVAALSFLAVTPVNAENAGGDEPKPKADESPVQTAAAAPVVTLARLGGDERSTIVNVKQFGAKGDGVSDDSTAIHNAMKAATVGSILHFPNGTYVTSGFVVKNGLRVLGSGRQGVTIQHKDDVSSFVIKLESGVLEGIKVNLANASTKGIWLTGGSVRVQNVHVYSKTYAKKYDYGKELVDDQIGIHLDGSELAYLEDNLVGRINGACVLIDSGCNDSLFNRLHVYTARDGLVFNGKSGGIRIEQLDVAEIGRYGVWIRGGRSLVIDGFYTANYGPPVSKNAWSIFADGSVEAIDGLKILNCYEEQSSSRSQFSRVYHGLIEGRLFNVMLGKQHYGQYVQTRGRIKLAKRDDSGKTTPHLGSLWRPRESSPERKFVAFSSRGINDAIVPSTAGWGSGYPFDPKCFSDYSQGTPRAFVYRPGVTDRITFTAWLKGSKVAVGVAIVDADGMVRYGKMTGNAGARELSLDGTIQLTAYDGKPADVQLDAATTYFLVPVAKAGSEARTFRRFHFRLQPMNTYHH